MGSKASKTLKSKAHKKESTNKNVNYNFIYNYTPSLESTIYKHQIVYDGFLRMEILSHFKNKIIPIDVISLCHKFYHIDLKHLLLKDNPDENRYQNKNIFRAAIQFWESKDYFICYELTKLLTNYKSLK